MAYRDFAERQLAAFCTGLLAAIWAAPNDAVWEVAVGDELLHEPNTHGCGGETPRRGPQNGKRAVGARNTPGGSAVSLRRVGRVELESIILRLGRDEAMASLIQQIERPTRDSAGHAACISGTGLRDGGGGDSLRSSGFEEEVSGFQQALRRLNTLAWTIFGRWVGATASCSHASNRGYERSVKSLRSRGRYDWSVLQPLTPTPPHPQPWQCAAFRPCARVYSAIFLSGQHRSLSAIGSGSLRGGRWAASTARRHRRHR